MNTELKIFTSNTIDCLRLCALAECYSRLAVELGLPVVKGFRNKVIGRKRLADIQLQYVTACKEFFENKEWEIEAELIGDQRIADMKAHAKNGLF